MDNTISQQFSELLTSKSDERQLKRDSKILMDSFLSEIERLYKDDGLNRKELAEKIKISESYVSQVFNGKKPLNFITLAKIKKALDIRFRVTGEFTSGKKTEIVNEVKVLQFNKAKPFQIFTSSAGDAYFGNSENFESKPISLNQFHPLKEQA